MRWNYVARKTKFRGLQTESLIGAVGCQGHPQDYGFNHSWITLSVVFLYSLSKNFNPKQSSHFFSMGGISGTR